MVLFIKMGREEEEEEEKPIKNETRAGQRRKESDIEKARPQFVLA